MFHLEVNSALQTILPILELQKPESHSNEINLETSLLKGPESLAFRAPPNTAQYRNPGTIIHHVAHKYLHRLKVLSFPAPASPPHLETARIIRNDVDCDERMKKDDKEMWRNSAAPLDSSPDGFVQSK